MVEIKFSGINFTGLRFVLTFIALVIMGIVMEVILKRYPGKDWLPAENEESLKKLTGKGK